MIWHQIESERLGGELKAFVALYTQIIVYLCDRHHENPMPSLQSAKPTRD